MPRYLPNSVVAIALSILLIPVGKAEGDYTVRVTNDESNPVPVKLAAAGAPHDTQIIVCFDRKNACPDTKLSQSDDPYTNLLPTEMCVFATGLGMQVERPGAGSTGQSRRRGAARFSDISVAKGIDGMSARLLQWVAEGRVTPDVGICVVDAQPPYKERYRYELKNVLISSYSTGTSEGNPGTEEVNLNFEEIRFVTTTEDGVVREMSWRIERGAR